MRRVGLSARRADQDGGEKVGTRGGTGGEGAETEETRTGITERGTDRHKSRQREAERIKQTKVGRGRQGEEQADREESLADLEYPHCQGAQK